MVKESLAGSRVAEKARRHDVHPHLFHLWRRRQGAIGRPVIASTEMLRLRMQSQCG
jgi:transposase-like protein